MGSGAKERMRVVYDRSVPTPVRYEAEVELPELRRPVRSRPAIGANGMSGAANGSTSANGASDGASGRTDAGAHVPPVALHSPGAATGGETEVPVPHVEGGDSPTPLPRPLTTPSTTSGSFEALPFPIVAQRRAGAAVRAHVARDAVRVATWIASDVAVVSIVQLAFRAIRQSGLLGSGVGEFFRNLLPPGTLMPRQLLIAFACGFIVTGVYTATDQRRAELRVLGGTAVAFALIFWNQAWMHVDLVRSAAILGAMGLVSGLLILDRRLVARLLPMVESMRPQRARALIIGTPEDARSFRRRAPADEFPLHLVGYVRVDGYDDPASLGLVSHLTRIIASHRIDTVIICGERATHSAAELAWVAEQVGCQVFLMPSPVLADFDPSIAWHGGVPLVQLTRPSLHAGQLVLKRAGDVVASAVLMMVLAPVYAAIALAVKLASTGPILFRQVRVGAGGRHFTMYKFRSMVHDAEARRSELTGQSLYGDGRLFKVVNDPRITKVGRFLRQTSLDELPQLWNVLRGDMSLVGPRPPLPSEVALYDEHHYARFQMKPGITGPWQVSGRNKVTEFQQVVHLETAYMRQWSITKDVSILLRTIPAVFHAEGAL